MKLIKYKEKKYKFKLFPAVRYIGKMEITETLYKITIATQLLKDEEVFIGTLIHEIIHTAYDQMFLNKTLSHKEANFCDLAHDRFESGQYSCVSLDDFHWLEKRVKKKMII